MRDMPQVDGIPQTRCPFCAELILEDAKKCPYCGEFLDPTLRGRYAGGPAYWDEEYLKVPFGGVIPQTHCLICCRPGPTSMAKKKFVYAPLLAVMRESQVVEVPLCDGCRTGWTLAAVVHALFSLGFFVLPLVFGWIGHAIDAQSVQYVMWGALAGFLLWVWGMFALEYVWIPRRQAVCRKIDEYGAVLRLPNATELQTAWQEHR